MGAQNEVELNHQSRRFREICEAKGIKLVWVASQLGVTFATLDGWLREWPGFADPPERRARLAEVLSSRGDPITVADLWPDAATAEKKEGETSE